jgi:transcriptional regulator with XRE-family HTH domain
MSRQTAESFGMLVRMWRERALLTQETLAERADLGVRTIRRWERDTIGRPHSNSVSKLAAVLNLNAAERMVLIEAGRGAVATAERTGSTPSQQPLPEPTTPPPAAAAARQLPAPPTLFTGRASELAHLGRLHDTTATVVITIDGMAGVGKTALAVRAAHALSTQYPDGQLFLDLHGHTHAMQPVEPSSALCRILRAFGVPNEQIPGDLDDRAALYRSCLAGRNALILLDNAADEAQVTPLLPGTAGCLTLVTSRRRLTGLDSTHAMSLDLLPADDAVTLFTRATFGNAASSGPIGRLAEAADLCDRLPLAIRIAAARLRSHPSWTVGHLVDRLRDRQRRLVELEAGQRSISAAFDLSYLRLMPEHQRAYRLLGLHPGVDIDVPAAAALIGCNTIDARRLLDHLLDAHLLLEPIAGRYLFHDLTRAHAAVRAGRDESEADRRAALTRLYHFAPSAHPSFWMSRTG